MFFNFLVVWGLETKCECWVININKVSLLPCGHWSPVLPPGSMWETAQARRCPLVTTYMVSCSYNTYVTIPRRIIRGYNPLHYSAFYLRYDSKVIQSQLSRSICFCLKEGKKKRSNSRNEGKSELYLSLPYSPFFSHRILLFPIFSFPISPRYLNL